MKKKEREETKTMKLNFKIKAVNIALNRGVKLLPSIDGTRYQTLTSLKIPSFLKPLEQ